MILTPFSPWRDNADLHNQLNRFVENADKAISDNSNAIAAIKPTVSTPAPVVQGGGVGVDSGSSSVVGGNGISVTPSGSGSMVVNTGVLSLIAGSGIAIDVSTGNITVSSVGGGGGGGDELAVVILPFSASPYTASFPVDLTIVVLPFSDSPYTASF